jgi:hypothetical protein
LGLGLLEWLKWQSTWLASLRLRIQAPVAQKQTKMSCLPVYLSSYSGGRDQEDSGSRSAQTNSLWDAILVKPIAKKGGRLAQSISPEFKL